MRERVCDFHATNRSGSLEGPSPVFDCATSSETCSLHERSERPQERRKMGSPQDFSLLWGCQPQQLLHKFRVQVLFVFSSSLTRHFPPKQTQEIHFSPVKQEVQWSTCVASSRVFTSGGGSFATSSSPTFFRFRSSAESRGFALRTFCWARRLGVSIELAFLEQNKTNTFSWTYIAYILHVHVQKNQLCQS